jgi:hypothetical protein
VSDLGIDQIDLVSTSCGGASHAPPACSGVRRRRLTDRGAGYLWSVSCKSVIETEEVQSWDLAVIKQSRLIDATFDPRLH